MPQRSVGEVSFIEAERKRIVLSDTNTMSTSAGSYSSLEDVQVFLFFVCFLLHHWLKVVLLKPCLQEEDDEYQEEKSLMGDTNNKEEGDETEEKILISKRFHLVSLKQTYTQKHLLWIKSFFFPIGILWNYGTTVFSAFLQREKIYRNINFEVLIFFIIIIFCLLIFFLP